MDKTFEKALALAVQLHAGQYRKSTQIPYISHLMAVSSMVMEAVEYTDFKDKRQELAASALLHDAVEDQGNKINIDMIRATFGDLVAQIVNNCTDSFETPKKPWKERKTAYIERIAKKSRESQLVSIADKLHNASCIVNDYEEIGDDIWDRFNADPQDILWYYESLLTEFNKWLQNPLLAQFEKKVYQLRLIITTTH